MEALRVDIHRPELGTEGTEYPATYRVVFWEQKSPGGSLASDAYELTGARDVREVLEWADSQSGPGRGQIYGGADRTYTLHVAFNAGVPGRGRVLLSGLDPTISVS